MRDFIEEIISLILAIIQIIIFGVIITTSTFITIAISVKILEWFLGFI